MRTLRLAFPRLGTSVILLQWLGNLILILLAFAWLQIPDSHVWQFLFSLISAAVLVFAFFGLHAKSFQKLRSTPSTTAWWMRLLVLFIVTALGYLLLQIIEVGRNHEALYAGYWNSKFSAGQRSFFTFERLVSWQDHIYDLLQWLLVALLLPVAFVGGTAGLRGSLASIGNIYRHLLYWLVVVLFGFAGSYVSSLLVGWTPSHGTAIEILSVVLRLGAAYTLDILLWCFVLALMATYSGSDGPKVTEQ
jgi:hypothetical protein